MQTIEIEKLSLENRERKTYPADDNRNSPPNLIRLAVGFYFQNYASAQHQRF